MGSTYDDFIEPGMLIAGQYDKQGTVKKKSIIAGTPEDQAALVEKYKANITASGGKLEICTLTSNIQPLQPKGGNQIKGGTKKRGRPKSIKSASVVIDIPSVSISKLIDVDTNNYYNESGEVEKILPQEKSSNESSEEYFEEEVEQNPIIQKRITFKKEKFGKIRLEVEDIIHQNNLAIMLVFSNDNKLTFIPEEGEVLQFSENGTDFASVLFPGSLFDYHGKIVMILFKTPAIVEEKSEE